MQCLLEDRICIHCGECEKCDIDATKRCDNCCACLDAQFGDMQTIYVKMSEIEADKPHTKNKPENGKPQGSS